MKPRSLNARERRQVVLTIGALGRQGEGAGMSGSDRIFVPGALPGETVKAVLTDQLDRHVFRASLESVENPAASRSLPPCQHYAACGGCSMQHMGDAAYRAWKTGSIKESLERAGLSPEMWCDPLFIPHATRRRASFTVMTKGRNVFCGFQERRSHRIAAIDNCLTVQPQLLRLMQGSRPFLQSLIPDGRKGDMFIQLVGGQAEIILTGISDPDMKTMEVMAQWAEALDLNRLSWRRKERDEAEIAVQQRSIMARFGRLEVSLPAGAFLQPSVEGETALTEAVTEMLADTKGPVADLFAGCGTFSGALLDKGAVHAVEFDDAAIRALNAAKAGTKLTVEKRNLFTDPLGAKELNKFSAVVLDPPRSGATSQAAQLARSDVSRVVYVSCNPAAFVKDAALLTEAGYKIKQVKVIDQFIWSAHTELVALLER